MKGKWDITANPLGGRMMYAVYRLRDTDAVDHSGNREYATGYMDDREEAERIAEERNEAEKGARERQLQTGA